MAVVASVLLAVGGLVRTSIAGAQTPTSRELFTFQDPRISESSGLAVVSGLVVTVNDSGFTPRVYAVDPRTGRTVGETTWTGPLRDAEALAPGGEGTVWVGDIGDNGSVRDFVRVVRLPIGRGSRTESVPHHELRYPDGARDAETLLVHPRTGRIVIVSKGIFGGVAYSPDSLSTPGPVTMRRIASGLLRTATDGAFFPDGRHVILRNYTSAAVYRFPSWEEVGRFALPPQPQGEGIAVTPGGRVLLSSEGAGTPVVEVAIPATIQREMAGQRHPPSTTAETATRPTEAGREPARGGTRGWTWPVVVTAVAVLLAGVVVVRRRRR